MNISQTNQKRKQGYLICEIQKQKGYFFHCLLDGVQKRFAVVWHVIAKFMVLSISLLLLIKY
jgi:hypothetical protein